jgi:ribokinase
MKPPVILVAGSANIDLVTRVPRSPKPGESLIGRSFAIITGGKGANQAVAAARLGGRVLFAGCVGDDVFGEKQRESLSAAGVDVRHLKVHPEEPTGAAVILVADEGQNSIVVTPSANYGITPEDVRALRPDFEAADAVLLQLEIPIETVSAALDLAKECGTLSILDAGPAQPLPDEIIAKADIISPNETEAAALTGIAVKNLEDARRAAAALLVSGAGAVVLKLGALGALYAARDGECFAEAFPVQAADTTAAGDAFTAALAIAWKSRPPAEALRFANAAGALATLTAGAQPAMPERERVDQFLEEQQQ